MLFKQRCIVVDIDGTIADITHRLHFIEGKSPDWDTFNEAMVDDAPKKEIIKLVQMYNTAGYGIIFCTGRMEQYRVATVQWMQKYNVPYDLIYFRKDNDTRSDDVIKTEIYHTHLCNINIEFVIDDRQKVVDMWRRKGLICLQCQKGDY